MDFDLFTPEVLWFLLGTTLLLLELALPSLIIIFFGIGAWLTAISLLFFNFEFTIQLLVFISTSLLTLFSLRQSIRKKYMDFSVAGSSSQNNEFIGGKAISLTNFGPDKEGKVEFNGSQWEASSTTAIKANMAVKIIGMKSIKLIVEPFKT